MRNTFIFKVKTATKLSVLT